MRWKSSLLNGYRLCATALVGVGALTVSACTSPTPAPAPSPIQGTVQRIVGDTLFVDINGRSTEVQLAGVELPTSDATAAPACLQQETVRLVDEVSPSGSMVRLEVDSSGPGSTDSMSAEVFVGDKSLNEVVVGAGLGVVSDADGSAPAPASIAQAQESARVNRVGLFSAQVPCTVPGQVLATVGVDCLNIAASAAAVTSVAPSPATANTASATSTSSAPTGVADGSIEFDSNSSSSELSAIAASAARTLASAKAGQQALGNQGQLIWRALSAAQRDACSRTMADFVSTNERSHTAILAALATAKKREAEAARVAKEKRVAAEKAAAARAAEVKRLAAEAEAARAAEAARVAAEAEAARVAEQEREAAAEQQRQADEAAAEQARQAEASRAAEQQQDDIGNDSAPSPPDSAGGGSGGAYPDYTGPRCYAPGGQTWKPC